jgi:nicotinamidase-related amidase
MDAGTALLIIDIQEFYFPGGFAPLEKPEAASRNVARILEKFRANDRLVVHVGHNVSKEKAFHKDVMPLDGEKIFFKDEVSAFNGTDLNEYLRENKIDRLVVCGMQTHMCVEGAVRAAYDLGFECILIGDACATRTLKFEDKSIDAAEVHFSTLSSLNGNYATVVDTETFLRTY